MMVWRMSVTYPIPVIDIFAGPGGLSEGFASLRLPAGRPVFDIALSIEKNRFAHATLELRAFFRQARDTGNAADYYRYIRGPDHPEGIDRKTLFSRHPEVAAVAKAKAWHKELCRENRAEISARIEKVLRSYPQGAAWVLLGGPPCQAYSIAGRSRMRRTMGSRFEEDERHTLYEEYLAILADHKPHIFVMENVKGLLSSQLRSKRIFDLMLPDLRDAAGRGSYTLFPFVKSRERSRTGSLFANNGYDLEPGDFLIQCEKHGVPQARHRVIILGIRSDLLNRVPGFEPPVLKERTALIPVARVLDGLPRLRSGLTRIADTPEAWRAVLEKATVAPWLRGLDGDDGRLLIRKIRSVIDRIRLPQADRGARFLPSNRVYIRYRPDWYLDRRLRGVCNHEARTHMASDLHRYLFAACYAAIHGVTPKLGTWPSDLLPNHANVSQALRHGMFNDRFRVQVRGQPATTRWAPVVHHYHMQDGSAQKAMRRLVVGLRDSRRVSQLVSL